MGDGEPLVAQQGEVQRAIGAGRARASGLPARGAGGGGFQLAAEQANQPWAPSNRICAVAVGLAALAAAGVAFAASTHSMRGPPPKEDVAGDDLAPERVATEPADDEENQSEKEAWLMAPSGDMVVEAPLVDMLDGCNPTKVIGQLHGGQELKTRTLEERECIEVLGDASPSGGTRHGADGQDNESPQPLPAGRAFLRSDGTVRPVWRPMSRDGPRCPPPLVLDRYRKNCITPYEPHLMTFYMYQAQGDGEAPLEPGTLGNLPAVAARLHSQVVVSCPRGGNITRIQRYKVTMLTTWEAFEDGGGHFADGEAMGEAMRCGRQNSSVTAIWEAYGSIPGCAKMAIDESSGYRDRLWVSLPGRCPSAGHEHATGPRVLDAEAPPSRRDPDGPENRRLEAASLRAGGRCDAPTGARDCTWSAEPDGELLLDEIAGVKDGASVCESGRREFIPGLGRGNGVTFWDNKHDPERCAERTAALTQMFAKRFPTEPGLVDPLCLPVKDPALQST